MPYFNPSYTARDYDSIKQFLIDFIPTVTSNWTDFNESDLGTTFIEMLSAFGDLQSYQLDMQALETYLGTVQQRSNAQNILKLIGYYMSGYSAPVAQLNFNMSVAWPNPIPIPAYYTVQTSGSSPVTFATQNAVNILPLTTPGPQTVSVNAWQGSVVNLTIPYTNVQSDGTYTMSDQNVDVTTMQLVIGGTTWTQVNNVYFQYNQNQVYSIEIIEDYPVIALGGTWQNYLNSVNQNMDITYVSTLGPAGSVGANTLTIMNTPIYDSLGNNVSSYITVTNPLSSSAGSLPETVDQARQNGPQTALSDNMAITLSDYVNQTKNYPGVFNAIALDANSPNSGITETLYTRVIVVPNGFGSPSQTLLSNIQTYLQNISLPNMTLDVIAPTYYSVDVSTTVYIPSGQSAQSSTVQAAVTSFIQNYFLSSNITFNAVIRFSSLISGIQGSSSLISYVEMQYPTSDVTLPSNSYPVLGTLSVSIGLV